MSARGEIAFVVPERDLFHERPNSVEDARQKAGKQAGFTRDELHMHGRITGGTLTVHCTSTGYSCPDRVMVFEKGR